MAEIPQAVETAEDQSYPMPDATQRTSLKILLQRMQKASARFMIAFNWYLSSA